MTRPAPRTRASKASAVTFGLALAALLLVASGGGCEAIVPGSLEPFHCGSTSLSSCPTGQMCATSTGQCVSVSQACTVTQCTAPLVCDPGSLECVSPSTMMMPDSSMPMMVDSARPPPEDVITRDTTTPPVDSRTVDVTPDITTADASCGVGCPCTPASAECKGASLFCADGTVLPGLVTSGICTQVCCTSSDCPDGSVCYASGTPGNYCVPVGLVGLASTGTAQGAAECGENGDCRSGRCDDTSGSCVDTCCSDSSCATDTFCALDLSPPSTLHEGFYCAAESPPGGPAGSMCGSPTDCSSEACLMIGTCTSNCCGAASCTASGGNACGTNMTSSQDSVNVCGTSTTGSAFGSQCTQDDKCSSQVCDTALGKCTDFCCVDQDCAGFGTGYVCRPRTSSSPAYLICVKSS